MAGVDLKAGRGWREDRTRYGQGLSGIRRESFGTSGKYLAVALSCAVPSRAPKTKSFCPTTEPGSWLECLGSFLRR